MKGFTASLLLACSLLSGCEQPGEQYLGTWQDTRSTSTTLSIVRNEDQFMINETRFAMSPDQPETKQIPALYRDGSLILRNGQTPSHMTIDQASGNLNNGLREFRRIN